MTFRTLTRALCLSLATLMPVTTALAQDVKERTIKFASRTRRATRRPKGLKSSPT
ncbi:hypothetical protein Tfont_02365 [Tepidimonas fonticaldi]|jgi:hypothetical protein|uniref:Uncharacterized protein n=1 Tax=Tepidimonas fonticaldi TaxID=1101373 RepID=A0A554XHA3_9BURK|nr:hypothetical protein Tfont_02365 [Tepidimonas fonticaldi]